MSFQQGLSGLAVNAKALDVTSNNIANTSTVGFKSSKGHFADMYAGAMQGGGGTQAGIGATVTAVAQQFQQGTITATNNPLDLAINGRGFFGVFSGGVEAFTRNGEFHLDKDGYVVNDAGQNLRGVNRVLSGGSYIIPSAADPRDSVQIPFAGTPQQTNALTLEANLNSAASVLPAAPAFNPTNAATYNNSTALTVYDQQGTPYTMTMYFRKTATDAWNMYTRLADSAGTVIAPTTTDPIAISFNANGTINAGASGTFAFTYPATATQTITIPAANVNVSALTQYGSPFAVTGLSQNGYAKGDLAGVTVTDDGFIEARYNNGQSVQVAKLALFSFKNENGLQPTGGNQWIATTLSGARIPGDPGTGLLGNIRSMATEDSNVDMTAELVNMIVQQRNYQANAQSIKTQDQILQTLLNIR